MQKTSADAQKQKDKKASRCRAVDEDKGRQVRGWNCSLGKTGRVGYEEVEMRAPQLSRLLPNLKKKRDVMGITVAVSLHGVHGDIEGKYMCSYGEGCCANEFHIAL